MDFGKEVIERSHVVPVLVDFWAEWCGPCKLLGPILERIAEREKGRFELVKVDTENNQDLAAHYGIRSIPHVKLFVDGKAMNEFTGALPESTVVQWLEKTLPNKFRKDIERAEQLVRDDRHDEAQVLLRTVLGQQPGNQDAQAMLARTLVFSDPFKAVEMVRDIDESSKRFPLVEAIRTIGALAKKMQHPDLLPDDPVKRTYLRGAEALSKQDFESALDIFIEAIRVNRFYDDDGARKACIAVFKMVGEEHDLARSRRRDFSSALNS